MSSKELISESLNNKTDNILKLVLSISLLVLFISIGVSSLYYYNAPNSDLNIVFESPTNYDIKHDKHNLNFPYYKLTSRYSFQNKIILDVILEKKGRSNIIQTTIHNLKVEILLSKNKARVQIYEEKKEKFRIPENLYDYNDFNLENDDKVNSIDESNIDVQINNHPFGLKLLRRSTGEELFDTTHSFNSDQIDDFFYVADNFLRISSRLPKNHKTYGLGERLGEFLLEKGEFLLYSENLNKIPVIDRSNKYSSQPFYLTVNPQTQNCHGVFILNSSPMEAKLSDESLSFKMTSGIIDLFIFSGNSAENVVKQFQHTVGIPILPQFSSLNWNSNLISVNPTEDLVSVINIFRNLKNNDNLVFDSIWIDYDDFITPEKKQSFNNFVDICEKEFNIKVYKQTRSPLPVNSEYFEMAKSRGLLIRKGLHLSEPVKGLTRIGEVVFLDYFNPDITDFIKNTFYVEKSFNYNTNRFILSQNEPSHYCTGSCDGVGNNGLNIPYLPNNNSTNLEKNSLPLGSVLYQNVLMLDIHNLYGLSQIKRFSVVSKDYEVERPYYFTRSSFPGFTQYCGKWLGNLPSNTEGLKQAIIQTLSFNIYGTPHVVHEACGYNVFDINNKNKKNFEYELCLRWIQAFIFNPAAKMNFLEIFNFLENRKDDHKKLLKSMRLRFMLINYIYTNLARISSEGGTFMKPIFFEFSPSHHYFNEIMGLTSQFMLGDKLIFSPVLIPGERKKRTYFPNHPFYDFFDGKLVNKNGEGWYDSIAGLDTVPLFIKGGSIVQFQTPNANTNNVERLREIPFEICVGLDAEYNSKGEIYLDDGQSNLTILEKRFYKLEMKFYKFMNETKTELHLDFNIAQNGIDIKTIQNSKIKTIKIYGFDLKIKRVIKLVDNIEIEILNEFVKYEKDKRMLILTLNTENFIEMDQNTKLKLIE